MQPHVYTKLTCGRQNQEDRIDSKALFLRLLSNKPFSNVPVFHEFIEYLA